MSQKPKTPLLDQISEPADLAHLSDVALERLAEELRQEVIWIVSQTGGHLGAGLGVVELTVALHRVFDTPRDKLIWDVGHQSYPHKILTGRREAMKDLRQEGGVSGFTKRSESSFDPFGAAHSSTSISAALGFAVARDLRDAEDIGDTIAVIGDGAISAGMAYEAMNNAGHLGKRLFVILNDNGRSIDAPVGAMSSYLAKLYSNNKLQDFKEATNSAISLLPDPLRKSAERARDLVKQAGFGGTFFESLGFDYVGPIDGHDMSQLLPVLRTLKDRARGPVLLHVVTQKGKGYAPAEQADDRGHTTAKFDVPTGKQHKSPRNAPTYSQVFGSTLVDLAAKDDKIVSITAAMTEGTGLELFAKRYPSRCFDVAIAEQHGVTFAAALAAGGMKPFCAIYSTFLQRAYDQIVHDVAIQGLPVRFAIDRAGLVGADGATHAGAFDTAFLANLPGMVVMAASDEQELVHMVATAAEYDAGPIAFRYPRGQGIGAQLPESPEILQIGKGRLVQSGERVAILSFGTRLDEVQTAATQLASEGIHPTIADARFAKPLDKALILELAAKHDVLITIEEGAVGGFGSHVAQLLAENGVFDSGLKFRSMVLPDQFLDHATPDAMYNTAELNAAHIAKKVSGLLSD